MPTDSAHSDAPPVRPMGSPVVLIVDDDAGMRTYMQQCLEPLPVSLAFACDGEAALELLERDLLGDLALVLTDIHMPGMDGLALKEALSRDRRWKSVPVILVTGESLRARDGPVLRKPFNARSLGDAVRNSLRLPHATTKDFPLPL